MGTKKVKLQHRPHNQGGKMVDLYEQFEFPQDFKPDFCNSVIISHTDKEFYITFGIGYPSSKKVKVINQIIVTPTHLQEIILTMQNQLKQQKENKGGGSTPPTTPPSQPPKPRF